ncbi:MAG: hypothetical protein ACLS7Y_01525 [Thomasclavelia spiroformis]
MCIILGKRKDYDHAKYRIHNIPFVVLGASLLLFGGLVLMPEVL